jgi:hypothetical protein
MIEWIPVAGSSRVVAVAYREDTETILVQFPDDIRWWYGACPPQVWEEFNAPGTSKGTYIARVLNYHPNGRYEG